MIFILLSILIKIYLFFNVLQKSYYEYKALFVYIFKRYYILLLSNIAIGLLLFFKNYYLNFFVISSLIIQLGFLLKKSKVFLKITKRIIRLFFTVVCEIIILSFFVPYFIIDLLVPVVIVAADIINKPIEMLIKNVYINRAKNKIKDSHAIKIAITGSYGKTSVKNYISSVLKNKYLIKSSPKSYNTPLGLAKFINEEEFTYVDFVIYEFGARRSGNIKELQKNYKYDIAIITEIGQMHIDTFKSQLAIINEKMSLVDLLESDGIAILNYENEYIRNYTVQCKKYTYGFNYGDFQARNIEIGIFGSKFDLYIYDRFIKRISIKPLGKSAIINVLPTIILCYLYDMDYDWVEEVIMVDNRLSLRRMDNYFVLDDAYNSNILGATYALEVLKSHDGKKYIITPGFVEMDMVILVKNSFTKLLENYIIEKEIMFVESFKEGFNLFLNIKENNSILLIENDLLD